MRGFLSVADDSQRELRAAVLAFKSADRDLKREINKATRDTMNPVWRSLVTANTSGTDAMTGRMLGGGMRIAAGNPPIAKAAQSTRKVGTRRTLKLGDELTDGAETGADAAKDLEREFKDTLDTVRDDSRKASSDLGDHLKDGAKDAESGLGDVKDEAKDSAREVAASFDGSLDGVIGGVKEFAANMGELGPIGAASGPAVAAGAGYFYEEL